LRRELTVATATGRDVENEATRLRPRTWTCHDGWPRFRLTNVDPGTPGPATPRPTNGFVTSSGKSVIIWHDGFAAIRGFPRQATQLAIDPGNWPRGWTRP